VTLDDDDASTKRPKLKVDGEVRGRVAKKSE
jgi:hypothetical protein